MPSADAKSPPALGFLTVVEHEQHGLFGGYLLLNFAGRPLEFHCTAPVRPNRAQQILYGPTLIPYIYGEQIGQTLVAKAGVLPLVICTDREPMLFVRDYVAAPVVLVLGDHAADAADPSSAAPARSWHVDAAHGHAPPPAHVQVGRNQLGVARDHQADGSLVTQRLSALDAAFDLAEPFARIRQAIEEAQRGGR